MESWSFPFINDEARRFAKHRITRVIRYGERGILNKMKSADLGMVADFIAGKKVDRKKLEPIINQLTNLINKEYSDGTSERGLNSLQFLMSLIKKDKR